MAQQDQALPIGKGLGSWTPPPTPPHDALTGKRVRLEPMQQSHEEDLFGIFVEASPDLWTYMGIGPFDDQADFGVAIAEMTDRPDWLPYTILHDGRLEGFASYLRIDPPGGVIEIGSIAFSPSLQRTAAATEAIYLMIDRVFDLGYRRCEWKCDSLNAASRRAADRFGFTYEGTFRQATHYKGRNRDTSWYSIIDTEWPRISHAFAEWLDEANFNADGTQLRSLSEMTKRSVATS